jgi:branched-chain amino acid aminotransferase
MPPRVKAAANYHNSRLALLQAQLDGYDDTILLTSYGKVAEGPGYNLMLVRDGQLIAPTRTDGILEGITRDTLLRIGPGLLGIPVVERSVDASELYVAEELFYCGSAAEVTPILSVDRHPVGDGSVGPITRALASEYEQIVRGSTHDEHGWLTPVFAAQHSQSRSADGKVRSVAPNQGA